MKKYLLLILISFHISNRCDAQEITKDQQISNTLKEFYSSYTKIISKSYFPFKKEQLVELSLLQKKYCTKKVILEYKQWYEDGHDLFTNYWEVDTKSLNTMRIIKNLKTQNSYNVSFIVDSNPVSPQKIVKKDIQLQINLIKNGEIYKINSIIDITKE
ncbi:hypothetical protein SGQ83_09085 [Flavobacterium sp. Fl-318]|uniref:DUF3828 domain-containing protein n=1 Tax=Flavobacterium cupriresistens TaxID=2893885 RepID=A0ABU4RA83_9FLAO|nr:MULTISPECIES: hypothetical protein [unclassified Flavobacterium]MDX6189500.1 hypothetical protein [Flavobacterium sp. Fl-318]UFH41091.1 hypothetical protein LNP23_14870 [Flavobacterium sp. F-323]